MLAETVFCINIFTYFQLASLADELQVFITVLGLVFIDDSFNVVGELWNSRGSVGAEDLLQPRIKLILGPRVPSGGRRGRRTQERA